MTVQLSHVIGHAAKSCGSHVTAQLGIFMHIHNVHKVKRVKNLPRAWCIATDLTKSLSTIKPIKSTT